MPLIILPQLPFRLIDAADFAVSYFSARRYAMIYATLLPIAFDIFFFSRCYIAFADAPVFATPACRHSYAALTNHTLLLT